jgi:DUF2934 family protein
MPSKNDGLFFSSTMRAHRAYAQGAVMKDKTSRKQTGGKVGGARKGDSAGAAQLGHDEIARRAFEISMRRGGEPGHEQEDWLRAERELREERARTP